MPFTVHALYIPLRTCGDYFLQVSSSSVGNASVALDSDSRVSSISVIGLLLNITISTVSKMLYPVELNDLNYVVRD